jgi:hypothetical protein
VSFADSECLTDCCPCLERLRFADSAPCIQTGPDNSTLGDLNGKFFAIFGIIERRQPEHWQRDLPPRYFWFINEAV